MIQFTTDIRKFGAQAEKTGWTYIEISATMAEKLHPGSRKAFRVKGKLDHYAIKGVAVLPSGEGNFILPLNATMRRQIKKGQGSILQVQLEADGDELQPPKVLMECLEDEPEALARFNNLPRAERNYFIKWIESAKSESTIAKRVAHTIRAMTTSLGFSDLLRQIKKSNEDFLP